MLTSRRQTNGGYALPLVLIVSLILFIGTLAFSSRSGSGLFGAFAQSVNSEARQTAESAIEEFKDAMNREQNRGILVAGSASTGDWNSATNPCTKYNDSGVLVNASSLSVVGADRDRFLPGGSPKQLITGSSNRTFEVESVQYLDQNRNTFAAAFSSDPDFYNDIVDGSKRTLIRITVIGRVVRNGRSSTARVAREFEVVPKCCKRSFGSQGAVNWGRDLGVCAITRPGGGRPVLGGLNGGKVSGSSGGFKIVDENGNSNIKAVCWAGNGTLPVGVSSDLSGTPNPDCATSDMAIGNEKGNKKIILRLKVLLVSIQNFFLWHCLPMPLELALKQGEPEKRLA